MAAVAAIAASSAASSAALRTLRLESRREPVGAEINVPLSEGVITEDDLAGSIGEVVTGQKPGRTSPDEITIFDSTGIALQDSAIVPLEYQRALAAGVGIEKKMIST